MSTLSFDIKFTDKEYHSLFSGIKNLTLSEIKIALAKKGARNIKETTQQQLENYVFCNVTREKPDNMFKIYNKLVVKRINYYMLNTYLNTKRKFHNVNFNNRVISIILYNSSQDDKKKYIDNKMVAAYNLTTANELGQDIIEMYNNNKFDGKLCSCHINNGDSIKCRCCVEVMVNFANDCVIK